MVHHDGVLFGRACAKTFGKTAGIGVGRPAVGQMGLNMGEVVM